MDNKIAPIEQFVKEGMVRSFRRTFDLELTITNQSNKRELAQRRQQGSALQYPIAFAELQSLALPQGPAFKAQAMLRRGIVGQATSDNLGTFKLPLIPMESTYQILYITNSFVEAEKFGKLWLMAATAGFLGFDVEYGVASFGIRMELDRQVAYPQRDSSPDTTEEYELTTSLIVQGYGSDEKLVNAQAATAVEVEGVLVETLDTALLQEGSPGDVSVFKFTREWPVGVRGPFTR